MRSICVFCGSSTGTRASYAAGAVALGAMLARRNVELVYGGADIGLMGIVADAVLAGGGRVAGVIPEALVARELAHAGLTRLHVVRSMHERKQMMSDLADGFIALPGGFGTLEELSEILTWAQLGIHAKPTGILNLDGYFDPLLSFFDRARDEGFLSEAHRRLVIEERDPDLLFARMASFVSAAAERVIDRDET